MPAAVESIRKVYRPRTPEASPFFKLVASHFDEFERVFPEQYQARYGFWRPIVRASMDKFLKLVVSLSNHAGICGKDSRG